MRKKIVAGNWKMNLDRTQGEQLIQDVLAQKAEVSKGAILVFCPPFPHLGYAKSILGAENSIFLGAQNCSDKASGAFTGEVSAPILRSFGVEYVILGHSERRQYFAESDSLLAQKVDQVLANGLQPIFCCGESLEQRNAGDFVNLVSEQLTKGLFHLSAESFAKVVIAYEPIWAIGTGVTASSAQAQEMHAALRKHIAKYYGEAVAQNTSILYGGSCKPDNAAELFACADVDGGLIGGASLKASDFIGIAKSF